MVRGRAPDTQRCSRIFHTEDELSQAMTYTQGFIW